MENINNNISQQASVPKDKRPLYIWWMVILANVGALLYFATTNLYGNGGYGSFVDYVRVIGFLLLISLVPVVFSKLHLKWLGWGVPIVGVVYGFVEVSTCSGWFCGIIPMVIIVSSFVFLVFYLLGVYLAKWNSKVVVSLLVLQIITILFGVGFLIYLITINSSFEKKILNNNNGGVADAFQICEGAPAPGRKASCIDEVWVKVINENPNKDVCSWSDKYKQNCVDQMANVYLNKDKCEDFGNSYDKETGYSNREENYQSMKTCWIEVSQKYPSINICSATYGYQSKDANQCSDVLKAVN